MDCSENIIFNDKDVKELSKNISKLFCNFVNRKLGDDGALKKYIDIIRTLNGIMIEDGPCKLDFKEKGNDLWICT